MEKLAIISTVKAPLSQLQMYVNYHLNLGIDEIILFFDDPLDEGIKFFSHYKNITVVPCSSEYWTQKIEKRPPILLDRQITNVNEGVKIAISKNCSWMTHIDCDELIYPLKDIKQVLRDCQADALKFSLMEAVSEQETYEHIFVPTLFKKRPNNLQIWAAKILGCSQCFCEGEYFRGHNSSKMLIKISSKIKKYGIHEPEQCDDDTLIGYPPRYVQNGTHCKVLLRIQQKNCDLQGFQSLKPALNFRPHPTKVAQSPYQSGNHQTA